MIDPKRGPFTIDELLRLWQSIVDPEYARPLLEQLQPGVSVDAGEDIGTSDPDIRGIEVFTQQMAQVVRLSEAIERTTEGMFILPWSGQTSEPASGPRRAEVDLDFERLSRFPITITFHEGEILAEEVMLEPSLEGGLSIPSGRCYVLLERLTFVPGETGPKSARVVAEKPGFGYNNPLQGSISTLVQPGAGLENSGASVIVTLADQRLRVGPDADVVVPEHVGQYIELVAGANAGRIVRMIGYRAADPAVPHGGEAVLAKTAVLRVSGVVGAFRLDEEVEQATTGAKGLYTDLSGIYLVLDGADATFAATFVVTGAVSGATATVDAIELSSSLTPESTTAAWRVLGWTADLGFTVTNSESPDGGRAGMLDELGAERRINRSSGETDDDYRKRVATLPDTVSPNAIRRAVNRVLSRYGESGCLREVGTANLPGVYCDADDAFDVDFELRPERRFRVLFDYERFRAYFEIGVPSLILGDFGFAYDEGQYGFYDASPYLAFYDGFPLTAAVLYMRIWNAVNAARAGGVGFDLVIDTGDCVE